MSVNEQIKDNIIDQASMLRMYEEELQNDIQRIIDRYQDRARTIIQRFGTQSRTRVERALGREINSAINRVYNMLTPQMKRFISMEADYRTDLLDNMIGGIFRVRNTPKTPLRALVDNQPIEDLTFRQHLNRIARAHRQRIDSEVRRGFSEGTDVDEIAERITLNGLNITRSQLRTVVRTALTQFSTTASLRVYEENADVIDGYQYVATLDSRTTRICARNDGMFFKVGEGPVPPLHYNCRSTTVPIVVGFRDLEESSSERVRRGNLENLTTARRAALGGDVPRAETYDTWLRRQPQDIQLRHLGDEVRVGLFREGTITLDKFTNSQGELISISALNRANSISATRGADRFGLGNRTISNEVEDNQISPDITRTNFMYDHRDHNQYHNEWINHIRALTATGDLELLNYRGRSNTRRRQNKQQVLLDSATGNTNNLFEDPVTGTLRNTAEQPLTHLGELRQRRLDAIVNDMTISQADKDYLTGRFANDVRMKIGGPQEIAALDAALRTFRAFRRTPPTTDSFQSVFDASLRQRNAGAIDTTSRDIESLSQRGSELQRLANTQVSILGQRSYNIPDLIAESVDAQRRIQNFEVPQSIIDTAFELGANLSQSNILTTLDLDDYERVFMRSLDRLGTSNSLDTWATHIGREVYQLRAEALYGDVLNAPGLAEDWWRTGTQVVDALIDAGHIGQLSLTSRAPNYRDIDGLQLVGQYGYERQRYIDWIPDTPLGQHALDKAIVNKRIRLGFDDNTNPYTVRSGDVYYRDRNGELTNVTVRTSGLQGRHNALDAEMARRLRSNNNLTRTVDPEGFASFMEVYLTERTRLGTDANGNLYLNAHQLEVLRRNDHETLAILRYQLQRARDNPDAYWTNLNRAHEEGRVENVGILTPHSGEFWRPAFVSRESVPMNLDGFVRLKERFAVLYDKATYDNREGRLMFFEMRVGEILQLGMLIDNVATKPSVRSNLRKLETNALWQELSARSPDDAFAYGQLAQELYKIRRELGAPVINALSTAELDLTNRRVAGNVAKLPNYQTRILPELDAAESGQGILAGIAKNKSAGEATNLTPRDRNNRLRAQLADRLLADNEFKNLFSWTIPREKLIKLLKDDITTSAYNSQERERAKRILRGTADVPGGLLGLLRQQYMDYIIIDSKATAMRYSDIIDTALEQSQGDADATRILKRLQRDIVQGTNRQLLIQDELLSVDRYLDPEARAVVAEMLGQQGLISRNQIGRFTEIAERELTNLLPIRSRTFDLIQDMATSFLLRPGQRRFDGIIPYTSFDGAVNNVKFWTRETVNVTRRDSSGNIVVTRILSEKPGEIDLGKIRRASPVLFVFGQDAAIAGANAERGYWNVYDGFGTHLSNMDEMLRQTRQTYAGMVDSDILLQNLDNWRRLGLPDEDFDVTLPNGRTRTFFGYNTLKSRLEQLYNLDPLTGADVTAEGTSYLID